VIHVGLCRDCVTQRGSGDPPDHSQFFY
jgi:hypothetical protein